MGKNNLILGTGRGKLGDIVFYRTGGEQRFRTRVRPTNPRTNAQLLQRCVVSTAVKFYSEVAMICNHAFQNYEGSLKNHQRFMKLNIDMLRKIALKNVESWSPVKFSESNYGNYVPKDSSEVVINPYQLSEGDLPNIPVSLENGKVQIGAEMRGASTYNNIANSWGAKLGDQVTMIWIQCKKNSAEVETTKIGRVILQPSFGDGDTEMFRQAEGETAIYRPNKENQGPVSMRFVKGGTTENSYKIEMSLPNIVTRIDGAQAAAVILSRFENGKWRRSTTFLTIDTNEANLSSLKDAMESYMKSNTSSLYLNQSVDGIEESSETYASIVAEEEEIETKTNKQRKNNKDAE